MRTGRRWSRGRGRGRCGPGWRSGRGSCCWRPRAGHDRDRAPGRGVASDGDRVAGPVRRARSGRVGRRAARRAGPRRIDEAAIVAATLDPPPEKLGVTHWSTRLLADAAGDLGSRTVARIWRKYWTCSRGGVETFKFSTDPRAGGQGPRRGRAVPEPAGQGGRALRGREVPDPGAGPDRADPADAARAAGEGRPTTTSATAPPPCSPPWRSPPARSPTPATPGTARPSSSLPQDRSPRPTRAASCTSSCDNYATHKHPDGQRLAGEEPADHPALHPDLRVVAEPGRDLLRDHHPPGHPPRHLHQRQGPHRRDQHLHRRLERTLPPLRLDQDRRRDPAPKPRRKQTSDTRH